MMLNWHKVTHFSVLLSALVGISVVAAAGCFDSHGMPGRDAGPDPVDAGPGPMCIDLPGVTELLSCPGSAEPGAVLRLILTTSPTQCCTSGTPRASVRQGLDNLWSVEVEWEACGCCEDCRCVGPTQDVEFEIGPLDPGIHTVEAGGASCSIHVGGFPECSALNPDEVIAPQILFTDQAFAATFTHRSTMGCGCSAESRQTGPTSFETELCGCCELCECIDPGYQHGLRADNPGYGEHTVEGLGADLPLVVHAIDECRPIEPTGLRIIRPDEGLVQSGERITWAVVSGVERLCCVPPAPAVRELEVGAAGRHLSLQSCVQFDCDCIGEEVPFEAYFPLGEVPGGEMVFAGSHSARIEP